MKKIFFIFLLLFVFIDVCFAYGECDLDKRVSLRENASNIKVSYEPIMMYCRMNTHGDLDSSNDTEECGIVPDETGSNFNYERYFVNILIYNMSSDFYIVLRDNSELSKYVYDSDKDDDGVIRIMVSDLKKVRNVSFSIYASGECEGFLVRTMKMTIPMYNYYYDFEDCQDIKDFYLCQEFITFDMDRQYFFDHVAEYKKQLSEVKDSSISLDDNDDNSKMQGFINNLNKYKYFIVGGVILIGCVVTFLILKKKVRR